MFPDVDFEFSCILNEFHDGIMRGKKCLATLYFPKVCNFIKKFDVISLKSTPTLETTYSSCASEVRKISVRLSSDATRVEIHAVGHRT